MCDNCDSLRAKLKALEFELESRDTAQQVSEALVEASFYHADVHCTNCDHKYRARIPKGQNLSNIKVECEKCGCPFLVGEGVQRWGGLGQQNIPQCPGPAKMQQAPRQIYTTSSASSIGLGSLLGGIIGGGK